MQTGQCKAHLKLEAREQFYSLCKTPFDHSLATIINNAACDFTGILVRRTDYLNQLGIM